MNEKKMCFRTSLVKAHVHTQTNKIQFSLSDKMVWGEMKKV